MEFKIVSKKHESADDFDLSVKRKDSPRRAAARHAAKENRRVRSEQSSGQSKSNRDQEYVEQDYSN